MTTLATKILCSINFWQSEVKKHWEGIFQKVLNISERKTQDSSNLTKHSRQEEKLLFQRNISHKLTSQKLAQVAPNFPQQTCQEPTNQIRHKYLKQASLKIFARKPNNEHKWRIQTSLQFSSWNKCLNIINLRATQKCQIQWSRFLKLTFNTPIVQ